MKKHAPGFSLVELLVALVLLFALAALSSVVFSTTREHLHATRCVRNLQTWGQALALYVAENNGRMPSGAPWGDGRRWNHAAAPLAKLIYPEPRTSAMYHRWYTGNDFNGCPSYPDNPVSYEITSRYYSYIANQAWLTSSHRLNSIPNPASIILIVDATPESLQSILTTANYRTSVGYPHRGKANALFADGHVAPVEAVRSANVK